MTDYRGDLYIYQGLAGAGQSIAEGIGERMARERRKQELIEQLRTMETAGDEETAGPLTAGPLGSGQGGETNAAELDAAGNPVNQSAGVGEQFSQRGKQAKALRNVLKLYHPDGKDAYEGMSADQLEGVVKGVAVRSALQEHAARMQSYATQEEERRQQMADDKGVTRGMIEYGKALAETGRAGQNTDIAGGEGNLEDAVAPTSARVAVARALQASGGGRAGERLLSTLLHYGDLASDETPDIREGPFGTKLVGNRRGGYTVVKDPALGGGDEPFFKPGEPDAGVPPELKGRYVRVVTGPKTSQVVPVPGIEPDVWPEYDDNGNVVAWWSQSLKGVPKRTEVKPTKLLAATDEQGNPVHGFYILDGKAVNARTALEKTLGTTETGGAATAKGEAAKAAPASYESKADVVAAYRSGRLPKAEALKILREKFGAK